MTQTAVFLTTNLEHQFQEASYTDGEIIEVIRVCTTAVWMVTNLVTKHLGWTEEAKRAGELFEEWGKH